MKNGRVNHHNILLDMSRAFDTFDRGILLDDLKQILNTDTLHLISLLLKVVQIQVKHKSELGKTFTLKIGSPWGEFASSIWFIFFAGMYPFLILWSFCMIALPNQREFLKKTIDG